MLNLDYLKVTLSSSLADLNGVLDLAEHTKGFVAHEVKIKGVSGGLSSLKLDFVGLKHTRKDNLILNADPEEPYLFETRLTVPPGTLPKNILTKENMNLASEELILVPSGDLNKAAPACRAHCEDQEGHSAFFGLRKKFPLYYSCICFSHLPGDADFVSKSHQK